MNSMIKTVVYVSFFVAALAIPIDDASYPKVRVTPEEFNKTIEYVREIMKNGYEELNIPVLDPYNIDHVPAEFDDPMIKADLVLDDLLERGLSNFVAYKVEINPNTLELNLGIYLDNLKTSFLYDGTMTIFEFIPLYGKGNAYIRLDGYDVDIAIKFGKTADGKYLTCENVKMSFKLASCDFQISGLINNEDASKLISQFVSDMAPAFIKDHQKWMDDTHSPILKALLNNLNIEVATIFD